MPFFDPIKYKSCETDPLMKKLAFKGANQVENFFYLPGISRVKKLERFQGCLQKRVADPIFKKKRQNFSVFAENSTKIVLYALLIPPALLLLIKLVERVIEKNTRKADISDAIIDNAFDRWPRVREFSGNSTLDLTPLLTEFHTFGGHIQANSLEQMPSGFIQIPLQSAVYPVCEEGRNRSQITYAILKRKAELIQLHPPHGAFGGVDPFVGYQEKKRSNLTQVNHLIWGYANLPEEEDSFSDIFGKRILRIGEETLIFEKGLNPALFDDAYRPREVEAVKARIEMRAYMSENFYDKIIREGGHLIVFNKALQPMLMRFNERAKVIGLSLEKVHIWAIEADDPVHQENATDHIRVFADKIDQAIQICNS